jgi:hypothetical protein
MIGGDVRELLKIQPWASQHSTFSTYPSKSCFCLF